MGVASVDCEAQPSLCAKQHIRAYPSIMFYKDGDTHPVEMYHGDRSVEAFSSKFESLMEGEMDYAEAVKKQLHEEGKREAQKKGEAADHAPGAEGCQIYGHLNVKRVPGNFHIHLTNPAYSTAMDLVNGSHTVGELWFGEPLSYNQMKKLPKESHAELQSHRLEGQSFTSYNSNYTYVHYFKVVSQIHRGISTCTSTRRIRTNI